MPENPGQGFRPLPIPWNEFSPVIGDKLKWEEPPMTRVKFIYREQVIQVIEGENSRKGELSVITRDKDVPAHEVEHTVRRLANASRDQERDRKEQGRIGSSSGGLR